MAKRLAALAFIFLMAGQVYAGVCVCLGIDRTPQHSCCKRSKSAGDAIRAKGCCETDCVAPQSDNLVQDRAQQVAKIKIQLVAANPVAIPRTSLTKIYERRGVLEPISGHRLKHSRAPELYLRHHSFLI